MIIYKAINKINDKVYIGQTTRDLEIRKQEHISDAEVGRYNSIFHRAIIKYGVDNFDWSVLEICDTTNELDEMEFHYMKQYSSVDRGYNMYFNTYCQAGVLNPNYGNILSDEVRDKMSIAAKHRFVDGKSHPWIGRKHTEESKNKMSASSKFRKPISNETRIKMSEAQKKRDPNTRVFPEYKRGKEHHCYGRPLTNEHKAKLSEAFAGKNNPFYGEKHSEETKKKMKDAWKKRKAKTMGDM